MKITRRQLKRIINEVMILEDENPYDLTDEDIAAAFKEEPTSPNVQSGGEESFSPEELDVIKKEPLLLFTSPVCCGACIELKYYFDFMEITSKIIPELDPVHPVGSGTSNCVTELKDGIVEYGKIRPTSNDIVLPTLVKKTGNTFTILASNKDDIIKYIVDLVSKANIK